MAHKESWNVFSDKYTLGEYEITVKSIADIMIDRTTIRAYCEKGLDKATQATVVHGFAKLESYNVEANDTTADVYATITFGTSCTGPTANAGDEFATGNYGTERRRWVCTRADSPVLAGWIHLTDGNWDAPILIGTRDSNVSGRVYRTYTSEAMTEKSTYTKNYIVFKLLSRDAIHPTAGDSIQGEYLGEFTAWDDAIETLVNQYFEFEGNSETVFVGRFAIDLKDAGGTGEDSDWEDPEDDGEEEKKLVCSIAGASSGRHNDPLVNPSFSYVPSDQSTDPAFGSGGDGGHGGGGGGGAATIVVYKFATNKAGSKEIVTMPKRHGYGSGGGKGGKGGKGCILIYY